MKINTRRFRGLFGVTLFGSVSWAVLGCLVGLAFRLGLMFQTTTIFVSTNIPGGLVVLGAVAGAIIGAINGLTFGALLIATERGKNLEQIRMSRFAALGGVATGATFALAFQDLIATGIGGVIGAIAGMGALWLARRAH